MDPTFLDCSSNLQTWLTYCCEKLWVGRKVDMLQIKCCESAESFKCCLINFFLFSLGPVIVTKVSRDITAE